LARRFEPRYLLAVDADASLVRAAKGVQALRARDAADRLVSAAGAPRRLVGAPSRAAISRVAAAGADPSRLAARFGQKRRRGPRRIALMTATSSVCT